MRRKPDLVEEDLFDGRGRVRIWDLLQGRPAEPFTAVLACELAAGGRVGRHVQESFPEIVVCTQGTGLARVDGIAHVLRPGAVVPLPLGSKLSLENTSARRALRYLIVKARG